MKKLVLLALASLPLSLFAENGLPDKPYIYVEGKAEIEKPADMVTLRFDLVARNPDQAKANQEVQAKANNIFGLLNERKIAENDVIAAEVKSEPQFEGETYAPKKGKLVGYSVTRNFEVKVRALPAFPKLVDELISITGVEFNNIDAGLTKEKETQEEIWGKALANARDQADNTAKAMGVKIDSVFAISPTPFPEIRAQMFRSEYGERTTERVVVTGPPEYRFGLVSVRQSVHVIYLISPVK
jgi:uncharacterized protein